MSIWKKLGWVVVVTPAVLFGALVIGGMAWMIFANWFAERSARLFCDAIPIGSNIAVATVRADRWHILWGKDGGKKSPPSATNGASYDFLFSGFMFDTASCDVAVDRAGNVMSKHSEITYD